MAFVVDSAALGLRGTEFFCIRVYPEVRILLRGRTSVGWVWCRNGDWCIGQAAVVAVLRTPASQQMK